MKKSIYILFCIMSALLMGHSVEAAKLFAVEVEYDPGTGPVTLFAENSSFPDLIDELIQHVAAFDILDSADTFDAAVRFYAVPEAFNLYVEKDYNGTGNLYVLLTSSLTGVAKEFVAVDGDDMQKQIVDWLYLTGGAEAVALVKAITILSASATTDGGPGAMTAQMADTTFHLFGFYTRGARTNDMRGASSGAHVGIQVDTSRFKFDSLVGPIEGERTKVGIPLWLNFSSRVSYIGQIEFDYTSMEGTEFYGLGADMGLSFRPVLRTGADRFGWQITPFFGAHARGSVDGVSAAILHQFGLNNRFEWRLFNRALISWISQYTTMGSLTLAVDDYQITADINQDIFKNGLLLEVPVFSMKSLYGNFTFIDTRFLEEAKVDGYQEAGLGLAYRLKTFSLGTGLEWTFADGYEETQLNLHLAWDL